MHSSSPRNLALKYQLVFTPHRLLDVFNLSTLIFPFLGGGGSKNKRMKRSRCCYADLRFEKCELVGIGQRKDGLGFNNSLPLPLCALHFLQKSIQVTQRQK